MALKMPETSIIVAGAVGGPICMYTVTPPRNALTLGATSSASAITLYREVFAQGFLRGWQGGVYPSIAACPQYMAIGPLYHMFASMGGAPGGILGASLVESAMAYGAETKNAQIVKNAKSPGTFAQVHAAWKPWGPGIGIHVARNVLCMSGLRVFCGPCHWAVEKASGKRNRLTTLVGDLFGNILGACVTAPVHQLYSFTVTTPELQQMSGSEARARMRKFLSDQYLITEGGRTRPSPLLRRDLLMRSMYIATAFTLYSTFERTVIDMWPR